MNFEIIDQLPFKEKKMLVAETLLLYSRMKTMKVQAQAFGSSARDVVREQVARNFKGASVVETIFSLLTGEQALILENDFIRREQPLWYLEEWSRTTYYKLKHQAIDQFIYLLYA